MENLIYLKIDDYKLADITFKVVTSKKTDTYLMSMKAFRMFNIQM